VGRRASDWDQLSGAVDPNWTRSWSSWSRNLSSHCSAY